jgi:predicted regulator of amino acid metabolism with ACT domain
MLYLNMLTKKLIAASAVVVLSLVAFGIAVKKNKPPIHHVEVPSKSIGKSATRTIEAVVKNIPPEATKADEPQPSSVGETDNLRKISKALLQAVASSTPNQMIDVIIGLVEPYKYSMPRAEREAQVAAAQEPIISHIETSGGAIITRYELFWVLAASVPAHLITEIAAFDQVALIEPNQTEAPDPVGE